MQSQDHISPADAPVPPRMASAVARVGKWMESGKKPGMNGRSWWCAVLALSLVLAGVSNARSATNEGSGAPGWLTQPMPIGDAIRLALLQNANVLRSLRDIEAAYGVAIQTRSIVLPKLRGAADYEHDEAIEDRDPTTGSSGFRPPEDEWHGNIRIIQSIYEGGRMRSALRSARLIKEQALFEHQTVLANTLLEVRTAYYDVLLAEQEIVVQDAAVKLLEKELETTQQRLDAGAVPRFNVLRAEVKIANARPKLIRARNNYRVTKSRLSTVLGYNIPTNISDDIPLTLTTRLDTEPFEIDLLKALSEARDHRPELAVLRREINLQQEKVVVAKSGYKPSLGVFAGYGAHSVEFQENKFFQDVSGPMAGVMMTWDIFDGRRTQGRVMEATAQEEKAEITLADKSRHIEQEVRIAYSSFVEAREVLESQKKVAERAEEAVRLADARYEAGSGTQLDVLDAQTSLTEARTTQVEAARDYLVARARLDRAIGLDVKQEQADSPARQPENKKP